MHTTCAWFKHMPLAACFRSVPTMLSSTMFSSLYLSDTLAVLSPLARICVKGKLLCKLMQSPLHVVVRPVLVRRLALGLLSRGPTRSPHREPTWCNQRPQTVYICYGSIKSRLGTRYMACRRRNVSAARFFVQKTYPTGRSLTVADLRILLI